MNGAISIQTTGLTKRFGDLVAVDNVNLAVREGEFYGFLGPNGAGKSTTIKMLCGLLRPTAGAISIAGTDLARNPIGVKRVLGVLPEEIAVYERLSWVGVPHLPAAHARVVRGGSAAAQQ